MPRALSNLLFVSMSLLIGFCGCNPTQVAEPAESPTSVTTSEEPKQVTEPSVSSVVKEPVEPEITTQESLPKKQDVAEAAKSSPVTLKMLGWNVESDGAEGKVVAKQLADLNGAANYDVVALCEVLPKDLSVFRNALGEKYRYLYSRSGNSDRLQLLYNTERFELLREMELDEMNFKGRYRSPIAVHLKDKTSGLEFIVMNNHLARGKAEVRTKQAEQLVEWARDQTLPLIALGDYNYDYVFATDRGNDGFRAMLRDNIWKWVKPDPLVDTNWYDEAGDGEDDYPGSMLDFAFVAGSATTWAAECSVVTWEGDFPDDKTTSDHRPVELTLKKDR